MKSWKLLLALHLALYHPLQLRAQDLEETIEDELDSGNESDSKSGDATLVDEEDGEDDEEGDVAEEDEESNDAGAEKPETTAEKPSNEGTVEGAETDEDDETKAAGKESDEEEPEPDSNPEPETETAGRGESNIYGETLGGFDDRANSAFERRIYRIFKRRGSRADQYDAMVAPMSSELYRIRRGDTLWDISITFFGDGGFWPKLWSENARLTNPHEIRVGKAVAFVAGTEEDAPYVNVTDLRVARGATVDKVVGDNEPTPPVYPDDPEAQLTGEEVAAGTVLEEQPIVGGRPDIPEPLSERKKSLKELPRSFVMPVPPQVAQLYDSTGLDVGRRSSLDVPATMYLNSYISDRRPITAGTVSEIDVQESTAGFLQHVLITGARAMSKGERFTAVMNRGMISHPKSGTFGPVLEVGGTVEITDIIDPKAMLYRGMVVRSVQPIDTSAILIEEPAPRASFSLKAPKSEVQARIIGGEFNLNRRVLGPGSVVYLDQGKSAGLAAGQLLAVRSTRSERRTKTRFPNIGEPIAILKIAHVLSKVSTAVIISAYSEVRPGDLTGGPLPQPAKAFERSQYGINSDQDADEPEVSEDFGSEELEGGEEEI